MLSLLKIFWVSKTKQELFLNIVSYINNLESMSYDSIKQYLGVFWPYMKIVDNVKGIQQKIDNRECLVFSSYSYLGMHSNKAVQKMGENAAHTFSSGNHGPRMLYGNTQPITDLENDLCEWLHKERALVTSSGYMACMSCAYVLGLFHDIVFVDEKCHNSIISGCILTQKRFIKFRHNSAKDLLCKIQKYKGKKSAVIIESVYSMDGTIGDLPQIKNVCRNINATLVVDEAHGLGAIGPNGKGLEDYYNMPGSADVLMGTFSKSFSSVGGYIIGTQDFLEKCEYYAMSNVFTASMSAYHCSIVQATLKHIQTNKTELQKLQSNTRYFRRLLSENGFAPLGHSDSHVIPVSYKYDVLRIIKMCYEMLQRGYAISPVCPPACSFKYPRFRITSTSWQNESDIKHFVMTLKDVEYTIKSELDKTRVQHLDRLLCILKFFKSLI